MKNVTPLPMEQVESIIHDLDEIDLSRTSIDNLKAQIFLLLTGFTIRTPRFRAGLELFRGIVYSHKPVVLTELSYPPQKFANPNRGNRAGSPMFYGASGEAVPFFEINAECGDLLVVSRWRTTKELLVNHIGYTPETFTKLNSNRTNPDWGENNLKMNHPEPTRLITEWLADKFSGVIGGKLNEDKYNLTIAIAEQHMHADFIQGMVYPTVQMNGNADNIIIKPDFIDSGGLELLDVYHIEVKSKEGLQYQINRLDWANSISKDGTIEWKGRLPQWVVEKQQDELQFTVVNGKYVVRDKNGNIVEPY